MKKVERTLPPRSEEPPPPESTRGMGASGSWSPPAPSAAFGYTPLGTQLCLAGTAFTSYSVESAASLNDIGCIIMSNHSFERLARHILL